MITAQRVALIVLDGWGVGDKKDHNALGEAKTPFYDSLWASGLAAVADANGLAVGLPSGQLSGSEVGHMTLGAGRALYQDILAVNKAIEDGSFDTNPAFQKVAAHLAKTGGVLHVAGLLSDAGVHAAYAHVEALLSFAKKNGIARVMVHAFTDGRDMPPQSAGRLLEKLETARAAHGGAVIASLCGRAVALDRNGNWDKTQTVHDLIAEGLGNQMQTWKETLAASYDDGILDEFLAPTVLPGFAPFSAGDALVFWNFRADRMRQLSRAFADPASATAMPRHRERPADTIVVGMTSYEDGVAGIETAFGKEQVAETFGELLERAGKTQLRAAESEKYAHVTFFFNGGRETPFAGETREVIPSPAVPSYAEKPEMSAFELTDAVVARVRDAKPDAIVMNYANADMVGHTGVFEAARAAAEAVDACLAKLVPFLAGEGYAVLITADHGNAECMYDDAEACQHTAHTFSDVPCIAVPPAGADWSGLRVREGSTLADFAPTMLELLGIPKSPLMTGSSTLVEKAGDK